MKTRDEFIAETAREYDIHGRLGKSGKPVDCGGRESAIWMASAFADELERLGVTPWSDEPEAEQTPVAVATRALLSAVDTWAQDRSVANRRVMLSLALTYVEAKRNR